MKESSLGENSQPQDKNEIEATNDEINLDEIDDYLDSCKPRSSGQGPNSNKNISERGKASTTSLTENYIENLCRSKDT